MPLYAPGSGPHKTSHENAGSDEIDATGLTGAGGGGGGWETESTDATKLETGRQRIWDENLDASIVLDGSITLIGGTGWGIEAQLDTGEVFEVGGDGIVVAVLASEPATGIDGQIYYNSATDKFRGYVNGAWENITAAAGAHNTTHQNGGADEISIAGLDGTPVELTNHIADATDAHDASAVSFDDTGLTITAADVQTMGEQLDAAISAGGIPATIFDAEGDIIVASAADTAVRLAKGAAGTVPTAGASTIAYAYPPGYELDYVEITTGVTLTATTEGTAHTVITGTSQAYAAVPTLIEVYCPRLTVGSASTVVVLLFDGATVLGRIGLASIAGIEPFQGSYRLTPTAATHQYIVKAYTTANASVFDCGAGGTGVELPAFIRITKV